MDVSAALLGAPLAPGLAPALALAGLLLSALAWRLCCARGGAAAAGGGARRGGERVLFVGPAGAGKTALVERLVWGPRGAAAAAAAARDPAAAGATLPGMRENVLRARVRLAPEPEEEVQKEEKDEGEAHGAPGAAGGLRRRGAAASAAADAAADAGGPAGEERAPLTLVDFPGCAQLRQPLLRAAAAPGVGAVVLVLDASGGAAAAAAAADVLFDLFTSRGFVGDIASGPAPPPVLVLANKADAPGARGTAALRAQLEAELVRLRDSRGAVAVAGGGGAGGASLGTGANAAAAGGELVLGRAADGGFSFADAGCCPCEVRWARASALGAAGARPGVEELRDFLRELVVAPSAAR